MWGDSTNQISLAKWSSNESLEVLLNNYGNYDQDTDG